MSSSLHVGVIARTEIARGLAIQTRNFVEHMPVERTLIVQMPYVDCDLDETWCPNPTHVRYDARSHTLPEHVVREWLRGLDVVFTVETPYDWQLPKWAAEMGTPIVVQGNPEFVRHGQAGYEHLGDPVWWWPTSWRLDRLPAGRVMPVPMPERPTAAATWSDGPLRVLHVVGKRAHADRNGTELLMRALTQVRSRIEVTARSIDGWLPDMVMNQQVALTKITEPTEDRWSMYEDHHVLVLPRRYGGLCLPALEAAACGLAVVMPDCSPNSELASILMPLEQDTPAKTLNLACGPVREAVVHHRQLAYTIDQMARDREIVRDAQIASLNMVPRWGTYAREYMAALTQAVENA